jgi:MFS family permease
MIGGYKESFTWMIVGRIVFGIGSETMFVGQSAIVATWFINYELSTAMTMISSIPDIGSILNGALIPTIYKKYDNFGTAFAAGFIICIICFFLVLLINIIDLKVEKNDKIELDKFESEQEILSRWLEFQDQ